MAVAPQLQYVTVPATAQHTATVICIHGLGDSAQGVKPLVDMTDPALAHVKWLLPNSPVRPVKANMNMVMPSWYDIYSFGLDGAEDEEGMLKSAVLINELIRYEIETNGIDPSRIILGGYSQGGVMSVLTGLTGNYKLAGIFVLSGWLPLRTKFKELASENAVSIPIFWAAGNSDPLVKGELNRESLRILNEEVGIPAAQPGKLGGIFSKIYNMRHGTTQEERDELTAFIKMAIPANRNPL
ncbi:Phospholipase/carboxylesterase [Agrocybe pediades]|nr:Phospholipase/carboxylesterase [Agrocybe pediades]